MTKNMLVGLMLISSCLSAFAADGHNGITFKMTQKQLETRGFVCSPANERKYILVVCRHMEMTGTALGYPTQNYEVSIGTNKKVNEIQAELAGLSTNIESYIDLTMKLQKFFPIKDEKLSLNGEGYFIKDFYRSNDKSAAAILIFRPMPPISKGSKTITFYSPYAMSEIDKSLADKTASDASSSLSANQDKPQTTIDRNINTEE